MDLIEFEKKILANIFILKEGFILGFYQKKFSQNS